MRACSHIGTEFVNSCRVVPHITALCEHIVLCVGRDVVRGPALLQCVRSGVMCTWMSRLVVIARVQPCCTNKA